MRRRVSGGGAAAVLRGRCAALRGRSPTKMEPQTVAWEIAERLMLLFFYRLKCSTTCGRKEIVYKFKSEPQT